MKRLTYTQRQIQWRRKRSKIPPRLTRDKRRWQLQPLLPLHSFDPQGREEESAVGLVWTRRPVSRN